MPAPIAGLSIIDVVLTPTTGSNDSQDGTESWTNPENVTSATDFAECNLGPSESSHRLTAGGFDGATKIPRGARVVGAQLDYDRQATVSLPVTATARMGLVGRTVSLVETAVTWLLTTVGAVFGGQTNEWNDLMTSADFRDAGFAVSLQYENTGILSTAARVRNMSITVSYQLPVTSGGVVV